jgi:electron transfer flavoprotein alpha subunit
LICKYNPRLVLIGATPLGIEIAPRLSARNQLELFTHCVILSVKNRDTMEATKLIFGENAYGTYRIPTSQTLIITVIPGSFNTLQSQKRNTQFVIENIKQDRDDSHIQYLEFVKGDPKKIDISLAEVIVALGRGSGGDSATLKKIERLAEFLGGSLGGSRPTVDQGWLPFERQIGQTGKTVSPKLLVAFGISGAFEFISGMKDSRFVIAINKDSKAPIFKVANLSLVGDLHEIVSEVVRKLESRLEGEVS